MNAKREENPHLETVAVSCVVRPLAHALVVLVLVVAVGDGGVGHLGHPPPAGHGLQLVRRVQRRPHHPQQLGGHLQAGGGVAKGPGVGRCYVRVISAVVGGLLRQLFHQLWDGDGGGGAGLLLLRPQGAAV